LHINIYTKSSAEAMAKYLRTSKRLQRIHLGGELGADYQHREDILCCFLSAFQESTSLKEVCINFRLVGGPSKRALKNMMTHTQSLRSLSLICSVGQLEDIALTTASSGLKKNTSLRELKLEFWQNIIVSPILTSLRDHPLLQKLRLIGRVVDLTVLETVSLSATSKITEAKHFNSLKALH
jgi:hypothetical protein